MAIRITIPDDPLAVRHCVAPLMEAALSLHVLIDAKGHPLQHPWVRAMHGLSPAFKRELRDLRWVFVDGQPDCFLPAIGALESFETALARVAALDPHEAAHEFARPLYFYAEPEAGGPERLGEPGMREALVHIADRDGPGCGETAALIFDDPARLRDRLVTLLAGYWEQAFGREWTRLAPRLEAEAEGCRERFSTPRFWDELAALRPAIVADSDARTLTRRSGHHHHVESTATRPLMLVASAYVWPHVRVNCDPPWPLTLIYPPPAMARAARPEPAPDALVGALRAVGDPVRLRALRLLAQRERSTEELAPLLQMGEAGLSRHLRTLAAAGLVRSRRSGYYVLYSADRDRLAALGTELAAFVDEAGT